MPLLRPPRETAFQGPLAFLAGPIQGADPWQDEAARLILALLPQAQVASPRREGDLDGKMSDQDYGGQVDWETRHLERAGSSGVILFWLAKEDIHDCSRAYAQTTRFELAEWLERHRHEGARVVVGIEEGFPGARYIRYRLKRDYPGVALCDSLTQACQEAVGHLAALLADD